MAVEVTQTVQHSLRYPPNRRVTMTDCSVAMGAVNSKHSVMRYNKKYTKKLVMLNMF